VNRRAKRFGCPVELSLEVLGGKWKTAPSRDQLEASTK
jgi:hypothetical protein